MLIKLVVGMRAVACGFLMIFMLALEFLFWVWYKMIEQLVKRPQIITFGVNAKGATLVIRKAAQGICWLLSFSKSWIRFARYWLWNHYRQDLARYFSNFYQRSQRVYSFFYQIYSHVHSFLSGP